MKFVHLVSINHRSLQTISNSLIIFPGKELAIALKKWNKINRLSFTGYIWIIFSIFYFQLIGRLPSILSLQNNAKTGKLVRGGVAVHFDDSIDKKELTCDNATNHMNNFFKTYLSFSKVFNSTLISPYHGKFLNLSSNGVNDVEKK